MVWRPEEEVDIHAEAVIAAANEVHRVLGPGFNEPIYTEAFVDEMCLRGVPFLREPRLAVHYKGRKVGEETLDFLVGNGLLLDLMAVEEPEPWRQKKMLSRLRATHLHLGMLINFNVPEMVFGIKRVWPKDPPQRRAQA